MLDLEIFKGNKRGVRFGNIGGNKRELGGMLGGMKGYLPQSCFQRDRSEPMSGWTKKQIKKKKEMEREERRESKRK